jgi:hypothetical protein
MEPDKMYIYESPDKGKTVYQREHGSSQRTLIPEQLDWVQELEKANT